MSDLHTQTHTLKGFFIFSMAGAIKYPYLKLWEITAEQKCLLFLALIPFRYRKPMGTVVWNGSLLLPLFSSSDFSWCMALSSPHLFFSLFLFYYPFCLNCSDGKEKRLLLYIITACGKLRPFGTHVINMFQLISYYTSI